MFESVTIFHEGLVLIQLDDHSKFLLKNVPEIALLDIEIEGKIYSDCISIHLYEQCKYLSSTESFDLYFESQL